MNLPSESPASNDSGAEDKVFYPSFDELRAALGRYSNCLLMGLVPSPHDVRILKINDARRRKSK